MANANHWSVSSYTNNRLCSNAWPVFFEKVNAYRYIAHVSRCEIDW